MNNQASDEIKKLESKIFLLERRLDELMRQFHIVRFVVALAAGIIVAT